MTGAAERLREPLAEAEDPRLKDRSGRISFLVLGGIAVFLAVLPFLLNERYESVELGYNYRIPETSAAIALAQLPRLAELTQRRRRNAEMLSAGLKGVELPAAAARAAEHVWHQYTVRVPCGRETLRAHLGARPAIGGGVR